MFKKISVFLNHAGIYFQSSMPGVFHVTPIHVKIRVTRINPICCFEKVLQCVQGKFLQLNAACTIFCLLFFF